MKVAVEAWDPGYGSALAGEDDLVPTSGTVDVDVEVAGGSWAPRPPAAEPVAEVLFVDGVRRMDAQVWVTGNGGAPRRGWCVSYAAGLVRCDGHARVEACEVRRGLVTPAGPGPIVTPLATYEPLAVAGDDEQTLHSGTQQRMRDLEIQVVAAADPAGLVVVDGPLAGRQAVPHAIGYVKSHRMSYLPDEVAGVVADLAPGERTPLFVTQTSWVRYAWYLRLPFGGDGHPWAGVVRCEASADLPLPEAVALADRAAATLPTFASHPHKDTRAPQNLYPIAGLERHLRRRLGDAQLLYRALRAATA